MNMQRVRIGSTSDITLVLLDASGNPPSPLPDAVTVTITRADGTDVAVDANATSLGNAVFSYSLAPPVTSILDNLTVVWTNSSVGSFTQTVEVVGGFLFNIAELRAFAGDAFANTTTYPDDELVKVRTDVEVTLERHLGFALIPRFAVQTVPARYVRLQPYVRVIRWITSAGATVDVSALEYSQSGYVAGTYSWPTVVAYEHGLDVDSDITRRMQRPGLMLAKAMLQESPVDDRASTFSSVDGGTYSLVVPGRGGSITGVPDVDVAIESERFVSIG
jgi:hypothetical protein